MRKSKHNITPDIFRFRRVGAATSGTSGKVTTANPYDLDQDHDDTAVLEQVHSEEETGSPEAMATGYEEYKPE